MKTKFTTKKEALMNCLETQEYSPYKLKGSSLPVSGAFFFANGEVVHRDLEKLMSFK